MLKTTLEQGALFGAPETIERLFVGLMAPASAAADAAEIARRSRIDHGLRGDGIRTDRLHVTLVHVGDYAGQLPPRVVADVVQAMDLIDHPSFELAFDRVGSFTGARGRHPHVLLGGPGVEALATFRDRLFRALLRAGVRTLSREAFNPHMTLAYGDRTLPERAIDPVGWRATEFLLIHSEVGRSTYHTLGRRALGG